ncbi:MAG TPA: DNA topoisomerase IB [Hyphomicrobiales bacterium]|nr:DNA topoisomerase IB [Hyphomicrobiales bacterium]
MASAVLDVQGDACVDLDPEAAAESAGLIYASDAEPGWSRRKLRGGFAYFDRGGDMIRDERKLVRVRGLAIPPAWREVWICPSPRGHMQATGRDDRGRKQYRYHPDWIEVRDEAKFDRLIEFAKALPAIRRRIDADLSRRGLPREKVVAAVVRLLDETLIRVGNDEYRRANGSYGLTTLQNRHVAVGASALRFSFKGKSGKQWQLKLADRRIARIVRACQDIPGQHLFQYVGEDGGHHPIGSQDVNGYIHGLLGAGFTAKHFRTWAGTVQAALSLRARAPFESQGQARRKLNAALDEVAARLVNTRAIARRCYVHPVVIEAWLAGTLPEALDRAAKKRRRRGLHADEAMVLAFLEERGKG